MRSCVSSCGMRVQTMIEKRRELVEYLHQVNVRYQCRGLLFDLRCVLTFLVSRRSICLTVHTAESSSTDQRRSFTSTRAVLNPLSDRKIEKKNENENFNLVLNCPRNTQGRLWQSPGRSSCCWRSSQRSRCPNLLQHLSSAMATPVAPPS